MIKTNEILMTEAGQGDENAFHELVTRFISKATRYAKGFLTHDIDDAVQDAFIKAWQYAPKFNEKKASFQTWFYKILHNTCLDYTRKIKYNSELDENISSDENIENHLQNKEIYENLKHKIMKLSEIKQKVIIMRYWEEQTNKEIAEIIGKTEKNVEIILVRARNDLREMIEKERALTC